MIPTATALAEITVRLQAAGIEEPRREARIILAAALGTSTAGLLARDTVEESLYEPLVARRTAREPLAYIIGRKEFWGLEFAVSAATLIPRPDTETLVEAVLESGMQPLTVLDLGTGTGCLLLAVLHEFPTATGFGVDINPEATALAQRNAEKLGMAGRAEFRTGDWAAGITQEFDLVLSNPPYIEHADITGLMPEVAKYEPAQALDGGVDGLAAYRAIIAALPRILARNGLAVLELGAGQAKSVAELAAQAGLACHTRPDLAGIDRAAVLKFCK